jgi:hypothetical protein
MTPRGVTGQDLTRLRGVYDPQISPDGTRVAFVISTASEERDERYRIILDWFAKHLACDSVRR